MRGREKTATETKNEHRKWGKGIKVGINERLMHQNLISFLGLLGFCHIIRNRQSFTGVDPFAWWMECSFLQSERSIYNRKLMESSFISEYLQFLFVLYSTPFSIHLSSSMVWGIIFAEGFIFILCSDMDIHVHTHPPTKSFLLIKKIKSTLEKVE